MDRNGMKLGLDRQQWKCAHQIISFETVLNPSLKLHLPYMSVNISTMHFSELLELSNRNIWYSPIHRGLHRVTAAEALHLRSFAGCCEALLRVCFQWLNWWLIRNLTETMPEILRSLASCFCSNPLCSMYGGFTYIWMILRQMLVNIPYMEHMGMYFLGPLTKGIFSIDILNEPMVFVES